MFQSIHLAKHLSGLDNVLLPIRLPGAPRGGNRDRLWLTVTAANRVDEFDVRGATPRRIAAFATARQPNTVAVDSTDGRLFIAAAAPGAVQIFDPAHTRSLP